MCVESFEPTHPKRRALTQPASSGAQVRWTRCAHVHSNLYALGHFTCSAAVKAGPHRFADDALLQLKVADGWRVMHRRGQIDAGQAPAAAALRRLGQELGLGEQDGGDERRRAPRPGWPNSPMRVAHAFLAHAGMDFLCGRLVYYDGARHAPCTTTTTAHTHRACPGVRRDHQRLRQQRLGAHRVPQEQCA